ncbi:hypothetical protein EDD39_2939 [Kitasatospora cineracea]|uniref:Uncharacterized protein n=2 Tax=Kitasatospora cineracea TaxID=88074 RepID=A0A8G1UN93_9ACTN|nr:hypothetical protein EDD39_2939 [Kitasatospora cineracea]
MVANDAQAWEHQAVLVGELGWFLVAGALDTPGQSLYSRGAPGQLPASRRSGTRRAPGGSGPYPKPAPGLGSP